MSWVGKDVTNAGGDRNTGQDGSATGAYFVVFFFSLSSLLCSSSHLTLLRFYNDLFLCDVQNTVQKQARSHWTGRDRRT